MFASMLAATLLLAGAALTQTQPAADDADRYVVVLEDGVDHPSQVASDIEQRQDLEVGFVYTSVLGGFSATIPDEELASVRADPRVDEVVRDATIHAVSVQTLPWGIERIGADRPGVQKIDNVNVYIIDTGIYKKHPDLNVVIPDPNNVPNFAGGKYNDCGEGHGTHVAGVVAARDNDKGVVGVVPGAPVTSVKVLGCGGIGPISDTIAGINWVTANAKKPAVANISLSAKVDETKPEIYRLLDQAVKDSVASGVFYSVAAGNDNKNACDYSPARAGKASVDTNGDGEVDYKDSNGIVTTAAVNDSRQVTGWSNQGVCVDLWAPGKDILSTRNEGGISNMSGTSMAAPHVGGTAALYLSANQDNANAAPLVIERTLKKASEEIGTVREGENSRPIKRVYAGECRTATDCPTY